MYDIHFLEIPSFYFESNLKAEKNAQEPIEICHDSRSIAWGKICFLQMDAQFQNHTGFSSHFAPMEKHCASVQLNKWMNDNLYEEKKTTKH